MPMRMRMRWTVYAGASTGLAGAVILKALAQRPNFYSAAVYLSQSSANLMILTNLLFVVACSLLLGLQKLLYGNLRPIEIEQLYEKAWFAVTETCLAMTVFRGEIGITFLVMFFALLTGKVWGWIGEGRVEVLEQQPPRNPRLFHTRLALSLGLSVAFDLTMLEYVVKQVMRMARPDMMVMFGFEFAVLSVTSLSTAVRYAINLVEIGIVREQKKHRIEEIKRERVQTAVNELNEAAAARAAGSSTEAAQTPTPTQLTVEQVTQEALNQPIDDHDVEVEGWEEKGRYMFYLDLATDFFKLVLYLAFFFILLFFYGLPIHILRDVFLTMRSFLKRISDFMKYRTATRDMNQRYPDATAEEIGREDVCIICREEMRPYQPPVAEPGQPAPARNPVAERMRPKKLPCGHILHFSCLRSWLERQQICPTCRANVVQPTRTQGTAPNAPGAAGQAAAPQGANGQHLPGARAGPRVYQFGPLRIGVGAVRGNVMDELQNQLRDGQQPPPQAPADPNAPQQFGVGVRWAGWRDREGTPQGRGPTGHRHHSLQSRLDSAERQLRREIEELSRSTDELRILRSLQAELERLRSLRPGQNQPPNLHAGGQPNGLPGPPPQRLSTLVAENPQSLITAGSERLPAGLTLPEGWSMLPLAPVSDHPVAPVQGTSQTVHQTIINGQAIAGAPPAPAPAQVPPFQPGFPANLFPGWPPNNAGTTERANGQVAQGQHLNGSAQSQQSNGDQRYEVRGRGSQSGLPTPPRLQHSSSDAEGRQDHLGSRQGSEQVNESSTGSHARSSQGLVPSLSNGATQLEAPQEQPPPSTDVRAIAPSLPSWGSVEPANGEALGVGSAEITETQNGDGSSASSSSRRITEQKKHATVEDLVEDPD